MSTEVTVPRAQPCRHLVSVLGGAERRAIHQRGDCAHCSDGISPGGGWWGSFCSYSCQEAWWRAQLRDPEPPRLGACSCGGALVEDAAAWNRETGDGLARCSECGQEVVV